MVEIRETHWEAVQAKTFTKWFNDKLSKGNYKLIKDIYSDLHDGVALGNLLKCLLNTNINFNQKPFTRIQKVENLEILLKLLKKQGLLLVNIGPEDIVDCNKKLILGLIWTLISKLSISDLGAGDLSFKEELLRWCKEATKDYRNVNIIDLSRSWQDGLGFNALIHRFRPELISDYNNLKSENRHFNLEQAFDTAEKSLQIPKLLDIEDVADVVKPDEKSMITYLSEYYKKFYQFEKDQISKNLLDSLLNKIEWSLHCRNFYEIKVRSFLNKQKIYQDKKKDLELLLKNVNILKSEMQEINSTLSADYINIYSTFSEINLLHDYYNIKKYIPPSDISIDKVNFLYEDMNLLLCNCLQIGDVSDAETKLNNKLDCIKNIIGGDNDFEKKLILSNEIIKNEEKFEQKLVDSDYKNIKEVVLQYIEFLNYLHNENIIKENTLKKACDLFNKFGTEISFKDFRSIIYKLGIFLDDDFLNKIDFNNNKLTKEDFIDTFKVILARSYDPILVKQALCNIKDGVELDENEHKNLYCFNKKEKNLNLSKIIDEFLK